MAKTFSLIVT